MKKLLLLLFAVVATGLALWLYARRSAPPEVPFAKTHRETLVSTVATNGKAEPVEWLAVRGGREGAVERLHVEEGQRVRKGSPLAELESRSARANLAAAEARIAQARADLEVFERGGRGPDLAEIESGLARARLDLETAERDVAALGRLAEKQAATQQEVEAARQRVWQAEIQIRGFEKKRAALAAPADRQAAEARLREANFAAAQAHRQIELGVIRAPMDGIVYDLDVRRGGYLRPGDLVARIGRLDRVRVIVYVDEPELGRVAEGMPVTITWDALPGRQWKGVVEKAPVEIVALGTRQVGEVTALIENPQLEVPAGANVNAEIRSRVAENALTIPKEALRRRDNQTGVLLLEGERVAWRPVKLGVSSITRAEILEGVPDGAAVALPAAVELRDGDAVSPRFP